MPTWLTGAFVRLWIARSAAAAAAEEPEVAGAGQRSCGVEVGRGTRGESAAPARGPGHAPNLGPMSRRGISRGSVCKLLGVAGLAGVAASGVVAARAERRRRAYTPDEVRARLQERVAAAQEKAQERQAQQQRPGEGPVADAGAVRIVVARGAAERGPAGPVGGCGRAGLLAARRGLGDGRRRRCPRGAARRGRLRRHLPRHRRRLRRRPQRAADRPLPARPRHARADRRDEDGPPRRPGAGELHARELPRLDRPVAGQPRRRHARPGAAALPAHAGVLRRRGRSTPSTSSSTSGASPRTG